jgi:hypothetical protein
MDDLCSVRPLAPGKLLYLRNERALQQPPPVPMSGGEVMIIKGGAKRTVKEIDIRNTANGIDITFTRCRPGRVNRTVHEYYLTWHSDFDKAQFNKIISILNESGNEWKHEAEIEECSINAVYFWRKI